jgi:hypothetical protein
MGTLSHLYLCYLPKVCDKFLCGDEATERHPGEIIAAVINHPGSWHDARVAQPIYDLLLHSTPPRYYAVADTAFPRGARTINGRIQAPLKQGERLPADVHEREARLAFNSQLTSYRQTAEWGMRAFQGSFGRLRVPLNIQDNHGRARLLEICVRLNNLRANFVGISQIRSVYQPVWMEEDEEIWFNFENMVFRDIRAQDRVGRFHHVNLN